MQRLGPLSLASVQSLRNEPASSFGGQGRNNLVERLRCLLDLRDAIDLSGTAVDVLEQIFSPDRWIDYEGDGADLARADLERLRVESLRLVDEDPNLAFVARRLRYRIATREPMGEETPEGTAVKIVTLWGAKGLTADHVFVVGLADEALPGKHQPDETGLTFAEHLDEQRRLLYVSLTRAKQTMIISRATRIRRGLVSASGLRHDGLGGYWLDLHASQFFNDLPDNALPDSIPGADWPGLTL